MRRCAWQHRRRRGAGARCSCSRLQCSTAATITSCDFTIQPDQPSPSRASRSRGTGWSCSPLRERHNQIAACFLVCDGGTELRRRVCVLEPYLCVSIRKKPPRRYLGDRYWDASPIGILDGENQCPALACTHGCGVWRCWNHEVDCGCIKHQCWNH